MNRIYYRLMHRAATFFARRIGLVPVSEKMLRRLCAYRPSMSYNESYFGEPEGLLKGIVAEFGRDLPLRRAPEHLPAEVTTP